MPDDTSESTFRRYVEEALGHVNDHFFLQLHPLGALLAPDTVPSQRGRRLREILLAAIESLRPDRDVPGSAIAWRKYRYLWLRYVEGGAAEHVAVHLHLSERQARRDHHQAVAAIHATLWSQVIDHPRAQGGATGPRPPDVDADLVRLVADAPRLSIDPGAIVGEAIATVAPLAIQRCRVVVLTDARALGAVAASPMIVRQVLIGLLTTAIDASVDERIDVVLAPRPDGAAIRVAFATTPGWRPSELVETSRRLAALHGLQVAVDSADGRAGVTLTLDGGPDATILVVDDNPDLGQLFQRYLGQGYRVIQTEDVAAVPDLVFRERATAITLDVMMPALDGWEALRRIKADARTADVPVLVCSVLQEASLARALGAAGFIAKPVSQRQLRAALEECRRPAW